MCLSIDRKGDDQNKKAEAGVVATALGVVQLKVCSN